MNKPIAKSFNTAGPCVPSEHYMLPVLPRLSRITELVDQKTYFIIHATRQSGKTTFLQALTEEINAQGKYYALYCSLEALDEVADDKKAMERIVSLINLVMYNSGIDAIRDNAYAFDDMPGMNDAGSMVQILLNRLCQKLDKDLAVFFDEVDCICHEDPLVTFLFGKSVLATTTVRSQSSGNSPVQWPLRACVT
jgi:predicted AAA+ superfamily ATPase